MKKIRQILVAFFFGIMVFTFASCASKRLVFYTRRGADRVRKDIGKLEGAEQILEGEIDELEGVIREIEANSEDEGELTQRLAELIRRIRRRKQKNNTRERDKD